jgi:hypothetical protein
MWFACVKSVLKILKGMRQNYDASIKKLKLEMKLKGKQVFVKPQ